MGYFTNKVALVTGAGSGLGRQLARDLAQEGAALAAIDLRPEPLVALAAELPGKPVAWAVADVTDREALARAVAQTVQQLGPVDLLIANAGIGRLTSALDFRAEDIEAQVRVNLVGVANSVEAVLPSMLERRQGQLVVISSLASYRGLPQMLGYCASKAGVRNLFDGLRLELGPLGIVVTTICPGWIRTPLLKDMDVPRPDLMELPEAASRILTAIRRRRAFYAFPASTLWRVRLVSWLPCPMGDWLLRQLARRLAGKEPSKNVSVEQK
jgi:NAD(P)-dependent dehydrogenase (short-subunit alcohol dehydrogenase family)